MSDLPGGFRKITSEKTREASVSPLNECIGDLPLFQNSRSGVEDQATSFAAKLAYANWRSDRLNR